jgi:hypothetical protein
MPPVVIRPIEAGNPAFVNQSAPSGPAVIPNGALIPLPVKLETDPIFFVAGFAASGPAVTATSAAAESTAIESTHNRLVDRLPRTV